MKVVLHLRKQIERNAKARRRNAEAAVLAVPVVRTRRSRQKRKVRREKTLVVQVVRMIGVRRRKKVRKIIGKGSIMMIRVANVHCEPEEFFNFSFL